MQHSPKELVLARLAFTATIIDLSLGILLGYVSFSLSQRLHYPTVVSLSCFVAMPVLYLAIREIVFGGSSIGKICMGLRVRTQNNNRPLPIHTRVQRFLIKCASCGLPALNFNKLPFYYNSGEVFLYSSLLRNQSSVSVSVKQKWQLSVLEGAQSGLRFEISNKSKLKQAGVLRIGRDGKWADLCLSKYEQVSSKHCLVRLQDGQLYINDFGSDGRGSSNGVYIRGKRLPVGKWVPLGANSVFSVANVSIGVKR